MAVKEFGSYVVGGRVVRVEGQPTLSLGVTQSASYTYDPNGTYAVEHAWVQYYVPMHRNNLPPVVLLHGGGLHGGMWDTTPDGRPGWTQLLVDRGFEVHVIDNVERGRAGWAPGLWAGEPVMRNLEDAWTLFRLGPASGRAERTPFAGCRFPVEHLETLGRYFCPRWLCNTGAQVAAFESLLARLGRAIVICHSQGGEVAFQAAALHPSRVAALIAVEPSGFTERLERLREVPVTLVTGDHLDASPMWVALSQRWRSLIDDLIVQGGSGSLVELTAQWPGTTHMPMMDRGSDAILDHVLKRL